MAGRWITKQRCREMNRVRRVRKTGSVSLRQFWRGEGAFGSFLITGGTEASRSDAAAGRLLYEMESGSMPALVLTESPAMEQTMIAGMSGRTGLLQVTSPSYRNYHFFYGWSGGEVTRFFVQAAELLGCASTELPIYIHAFVDILSRSFPPSLAALNALAAYSDAQVAQIGRQRGASAVSVDQVAHYAQAGVLFRLVLEQTAAVLLPLSTPDCETQYNLSAVHPRTDGVYLVNLRSQYPALMHAYFAIEVQRALARACPPRVVLSEVALDAQDPLGQVFRGALQGNAPAGASLRSGALTLGEAEQVFQTRLVLLDGGHTDGELEAALRCMGTYTHYEAVPGAGGGFLFGAKTDWTIHPEPGRLRVRPSDTAGCAAVLCGGAGEILLARSLR